MTYPSVVLLQDPPVSKPRLSLFSGFVSFFPPVRNPRVAAYIHRYFLSQFLVLLVFKGTDDVLALDASAKKISLRYLHFSAPCIFWLRSVVQFF